MLLFIVIIFAFYAYFIDSYDIHHHYHRSQKINSQLKHSNLHTCFISKYHHNNDHYHHHYNRNHNNKMIMMKKKSSIVSKLSLSDSNSYEENQNSIQRNKSDDDSDDNSDSDDNDSGSVLLDRKKSILEDSYHSRLEIQRWFLLTHNIRPNDVTIITTTTTSVHNDVIQLINELYRQILINIRILESDINQDESMKVIAFPNIQINNNNDDDDDNNSSDDDDDESSSVVKRYNKLGATLIESFTNTNIKSDSNHTITFYINHHQYQQPLLLCSLYTYRDVIKAIDFDDIDKLPVVNDDDDDLR